MATSPGAPAPMRKPTSTSPTERAAGLNTIYCSGSNSGRSSFRATRSKWSVCTSDPIALHCCSRQAWPDCRCGGRLATRRRSPLHDYSAVTTDVATARGPGSHRRLRSCSSAGTGTRQPQGCPLAAATEGGRHPTLGEHRALLGQATSALHAAYRSWSKSYRVLNAYPEQVQRTAAPTHPTSQRRSS